MKKQVFNPFLPLHECIPDGEPHVFDDRIYLFGSHDKEGGKEYCELDYAFYSAPLNDLSDWCCDGISYSSEQDPDYTESQKYMYAPDVVMGNDGRYYLYYSLQTSQAHNQPLSVAVCDTPAGKYEFYGHVQNPDGTPFRRFLMSDPGLINDGGIIRLYYGWSLSSTAGKAHLGEEAQIPEQYRQFQTVNPQEALIQAQMMLFKKTREEITSETQGVMGANTAVLAGDMLTVIEGPVRIVPGEYEAKGTSFEGHAFYEASSIRKIGGIYYFIYSSELSNELCYATSPYPDRDFVFRGTIISNGDVGYKSRKPEDRLNMTANNHGSIECINGKWYVFYHRQTHNSTYSRQACAEPIIIENDGFIPQVEVTSCGLNGGPLLVVGEYPAVIACNITNGRMPHITNRIVNADIPFATHGANPVNSQTERYITNIKTGTMMGFK
ncbi:MAG: hypothetical protein LBB48_00670, partial [Treponema sp.]|nr:hypothetical protein [Treponema sp.]